MPPLSDFPFSPKEARSQVEELAKLIDTDDHLGEQAALAPFFRTNQQIAAALGLLHGEIDNPNRVAFEYNIRDQFRADIVVGDSVERAFAFIELEDAGPDSIFTTESRRVSHWSSRFTKGFHQLVDWSYAIESLQSVKDRQLEFGSAKPNYRHMLIIGRGPALSEREEDRLKWHRQSVSIRGDGVLTFTLDDVVRRLRRKLNSEAL